MQDLPPNINALFMINIQQERTINTHHLRKDTKTNLKKNRRFTRIKQYVEDMSDSLTFRLN